MTDALRTRVNELTHEVIGAAIDIHTEVGPGLLESAYAACMQYELNRRGVPFRGEVPLPVEFRGLKLSVGYRLDLVVDDLVIVELKAVAEILPIHRAQTLTYLRLSKRPVALLLNFHVARLRDGIERFVAEGFDAPPLGDTVAGA